MKKRKYRIGFFTEAAVQTYQGELLSGIVDASSKYDIDIIRFTMSYDYQKLDKIAQIKEFQKLSDMMSLDAVLFLGWIINPEELMDIFHNLLNKPIVCLGVPNQCFPYVHMKGDIYLKELIDHLIEIHQFKKILMIGPNKPDNRIHFFAEYMKEKKLYDPDYIFDRKNYPDLRDVNERTDFVFQKIFFEKKLKPDVIISLYADETAILIDKLKNINLNIPNDIAITSWEESDICRYYDPGITTVYYPFYEIGFKGCELLIKRLNGEEIEFESTISAKIIIRDSCGCKDKLKKESGKKNELPKIKYQIPFSKKIRNQILKEMSTTIKILHKESLLDIFEKSVQLNNNNIFKEWLKEQVLALHYSKDQLSQIMDEFLYFRMILKSFIYYQDNGIKEIIEEMWINAQLIIGKRIEMLFGIHEINRIRYSLKLNNVGFDLITTFDMERIQKILSELSKFIKSNCFIYLLSDEKDSNLRLFYSYQDQKTQESYIPISSEAIVLNHSNIDYMFNGPRHVYLVHILQALNNFMGFAFYEYSIEDERIYHSLSTQLSGAFKGASILHNLNFLNELNIKQLEIINQRNKELENERNNLKKRNQIIENDLAIARKIQLQLIPVSSLYPMISFYYKPMDKVGGDFFDFVQYQNPDLVGIFISDVSGHGVPAALITSMLKSCLLNTNEINHNPSVTLQELNQAMLKISGGNFITALYGIFNKKTREFIYANAGHHLPFIVRPSAMSVNDIELPGFGKTGFPLAVMDNEEIDRFGKTYKNNQILLESGSKVLFYTDGLVEAVRSDHAGDKILEDFEQKAIAEALMDYKHLPSKQFIDQIVNRLIEFRGGDDFDDDVCIICLDVE